MIKFAPRDNVWGPSEYPRTFDDTEERYGKDMFSLVHLYDVPLKVLVNKTFMLWTT